MWKDKRIEHLGIPSSLKINPTPQFPVEPFKIEEKKEKFFPMTMADPVVVLKTFNYEYKKNKVSRRVSKMIRLGEQLSLRRFSFMKQQLIQR